MGVEEGGWVGQRSTARGVGARRSDRRERLRKPGVGCGLWPRPRGVASTRPNRRILAENKMAVAMGFAGLASARPKRCREPSRRSRREANGIPRNEVTWELYRITANPLVGLARAGAAIGRDSVNPASAACESANAGSTARAR